MEFDEYQKKSRETAIYPKVMGQGYIFPLIGLVGEAGEFAEKIKKLIRDHEGILDEKGRIEIKKELGDVLWYMANIATELDLSLNDVAEANIAKIQSRKERGKIHGEGDNR